MCDYSVILYFELYHNFKYKGIVGVVAIHELKINVAAK